MTLTVITIIHNSESHLPQLLASLAENCAEQPQMIVVDTGSTDGGQRLATEAGATVIDLPDNPGFGAANNAGIAAATGDITALLNPDVIVTRGFERLAEAARRSDALHVPRLNHPDGHAEDSIHPLPGSPRDLLRAITPGPLRRAIGEAQPAWATAAAIVARTETLKMLGPFDPSIFLFGEDLDLCLRARAQNIPTVLHKDVEFLHTGGHSTGAEDIALRVAQHRRAVSINLGPKAQSRDDAIQILEHGLRAFRARDRAYVRAIRVARRA